MTVTSLSLAKAKEIRSFQLKKHRDSQGVFVAEGAKLVDDLLGAGLRLRWLVVTPPFQGWAAGVLAQHRAPGQPPTVWEASEKDLKGLSELATPAGVLAVLERPVWTDEPAAGWELALDGVQNPGNLGTLIRTADWFGIDRIWLGTGCADPWSPKVVQGTMGSLARVRLEPVALETLLTHKRGQGLPVVGADLEGTDLYRWDRDFAGGAFPPAGVLVLGSEGAGLSAPVQGLLTHKVRVPLKRKGPSAPESLNVGVAGALILSELCRRLGYQE